MSAISSRGWVGGGCRGWAPDGAAGRAATSAPRPPRATPGSTQPHELVRAVRRRSTRASDEAGVAKPAKTS
jgi:hypothetical protein